MRKLVCTFKNTKERIHKGVDRINIKTLFFILLGLLCWLAYRIECQPIPNSVENVYKSYYIQAIEPKKGTTATKNVVLPKRVKSKKVNYSIDELKHRGFKTYTEQKGITKKCIFIKN